MILINDKPLTDKSNQRVKIESYSFKTVENAISDNMFDRKHGKWLLDSNEIENSKIYDIVLGNTYNYFIDKQLINVKVKKYDEQYDYPEFLYILIVDDKTVINPVTNGDLKIDDTQLTFRMIENILGVAIFDSKVGNWILDSDAIKIVQTEQNGKFLVGKTLKYFINNTMHSIQARKLD